VPNREARYLRRNALIVLGNIGDGTDARTAVALARALADGDPLIRAHAVWAAARLGRADLLPGTETDTETDATVLAELGALPAPRRA
jgi:epoxyqueuosine reductase